MTNQQLKPLIREMKELIEIDILGITSNNVLQMLEIWLEEIGEEKSAKKLREEYIKHLKSKKVQKLEKKYYEEQLI